MQLAHVADEFAHVFDLLVASGQAELDFVRGRSAFEDGQLEAADFVSLLPSSIVPVICNSTVFFIRRTLTASARERADDVVRAALFDQAPEPVFGRAEYFRHLHHRAGSIGELLPGSRSR